MSAASAQQPITPCDLLKSAQFAQSAREASQNRKYAIAAQQFREAYDACPSQRELLLDLAQALTYERNFDEAILAAQQYLEREPRSIQGHLVLGNAYLMAVKLPEAAQQAEEVLKLDPGNATALKLKGNAEYLFGNLAQAASTLVDLLSRHPEDEDAAYMLGRIYYQDGRIDHAMGAFLRVLKLNPNSHKAYDNLGLCHEARGETEMALRHYLTAIKLVEKDHPQYDLVYANLANLLLDQGEAEKAYGAAAKAAERNPNSARTFYIGGKALFKLGKTDLSLNWLERSTALDPTYPEPFYLLARIYNQLGQKEKAGEALARFKELKAKGPRERR